MGLRFLMGLCVFEVVLRFFVVLYKCFLLVFFVGCIGILTSISFWGKYTKHLRVLIPFGDF